MSQENHTDSTDSMLVEPAEIPQVQPVEEAPAEEKMPDTCPRCKGPLADPEGLGWCLGCGYCRATAEDGPKAPLTDMPGPRKPSPLGVVEFFMVLTMVPAWAWLLLAGIGGVVYVALLGVQGTTEDTRERALWCTAQIIGGVVLLVIAQLWALIRVAAIDDRLGARDAIIPFRLWNTSVKQLPKTAGPICLGTWALALIVTAFFVVGGLSYWLPKKPDGKKKAAIATEMRMAHKG